MNSDSFDEKQLLTAARMAEAAERYKDMCEYLHKLVTMKSKANAVLTTDERNLLSVAYKNVVGSKRQSWRMLSQGNFQDLNDELLGKYRSTVETELDIICKEVLGLLDGATKVAKANNPASEDVVFYLKMSGDYHRYLSEFLTDKEHNKTAETFYKEAMEVAEGSLPETHPTRLGLALNFSVCCYEILDQKEQACEIAKKAFDAAIEKLDTLNDNSYKDSTLIMQLLRDNLTLWTSEAGPVEDDQ